MKVPAAFFPPAVLTTVCLCACAALADEPERFAFDPPKDDFRAGAALDLRPLNEAAAGEHGWVKTDGKGGFLRGDGQPLRFWAVTSSLLEDRPWQARPRWPSEQSPPSLAGHARFLAKHGVNLVRLHTSLNPDTKRVPAAGLEDFDPVTRDYIWECVAAMKKEGIYTMLTPYWANAFKLSAQMGYGTDDAHTLLFFDPRMKAAYKSWLRELMTKPNPHTGLPLARDPALAILQIQNEDAPLFWTVNNLKGKPKEMLESQFGQWLVKKHGTAANVMKSWQNVRAEGDDPSAPRFALLNIWEMTQDQAKDGRAARLADQLEFWSRLMFDFHKEIAAFLKSDCGCRQLVSAGNWHTASSVMLNDALRWTYTANDVQSVNRYFPGVHKGDDMAFWAVKSGHFYNSRSFLTNPLDWPLQLKLPADQPFLITESSWTFPSMTAAEGPLLAAAYGGLTGCDGICWFAFGHEQWSPPMSANGYLPDSQEKFLCAYPDVLGQFPAAALIARLGYVRQGSPVLEEARPLEDLWSRRKPAAAETAAYDARKEPDNNAFAPRSRFDPLGFFVGPVVARYGSEARLTKAADLQPWISADRKIIRSNTGQHTLDLANAAFRLDTPCAQGVAAFFKRQRRHAMSTFSVEAENDYGVCVAVSMDAQPLAASKRVLIQCGTHSLPQGWKQSPAPPGAGQGEKKDVHGTPDAEGVLRIDSVGGPPWMVEKIRMTIALRNKTLTKASVLDPNGYSVRQLALAADDSGAVRLQLPPDALHVILE